MDGKIQFGVDYLEIMSEVTLMNNQDPVGWACAKIFLPEWGFSFKEAQQVINLNHKEATAKKTMSEAQLAKYGNDGMERIIRYLGSDRSSKEDFIVQIAAVAGITLSMQQDLLVFLYSLGEIFGVSEKEMLRLINKGRDLSFFLNMFGIAYSSSKRADVIWPKITGS